LGLRRTVRRLETAPVGLPPAQRHWPRVTRP
jgi:hypothetical protein